MVEERAQRRLAAILAADVVGYSRLMEQDEAATLAALKDRRKRVLTPLVSEHEGRIVKVMGDGVLVEFASAVNAVACAIELQKCMGIANDGVADDRRIVLRVGINLGDVVVEGGDLYGDGVIIGVRLQAMAEPGGICISGAVHDQVGNKLPHAFDDLGPCEVKNIAKPVQVFRVRADPDNRVRRAAEAEQQSKRTKPSIAVLPFSNMSGDTKQEYFSDGITEDIITELSRFRTLFVIARNSSFQYRGKATDVRRIASELGVQYIVEGSVRKGGDRLRITAQLIDAMTGNHLWGERYDRALKDVFAVQDEVVHTIVGTLEGRLATRIAEQARGRPTQSLAAYECVLQARQHMMTFDASAAEPLLMRAIELDPGYAHAYAWLETTHLVNYFFDPRAERLDQCLKYAQKAAALDPSDALCHVALSEAYLFRRQFELARLSSERAQALNPNDVNVLICRAHWLARVGRVTEALVELDKALQRDPFPPNVYWDLLSGTLIQARRYEEAIDAIRRASRLHPWGHAHLAACHAQLGQMDEARAEAAEALRMRPDFTVSWMMVQEPFENPAGAEPLVEGMRKAGVPDR
jgi:TolB-like protein/class 3 adenylate cyclase/Flp pilus assembly protein TadD